MEEPEIIENCKDNWKPYACSEPGCEKRFARPSKLNAHQLTHSSERPHACVVPGCDKAYYRSQHLLRHVQQAHSPEKTPSAKQFVCKVENCGQTFSLKQSLKKHTSRNHEEMPYRCSVSGCSSAFRKKHQLRAHSFEHKGVLPFQCDYGNCDKKFSQSSHLLRHKKQHQGYTCTEEGCMENFAKWSLLRKHIATDHKKMYKCQHCPKKYPSKYFLKEHESSHNETTEMLQCPIEGCPRRYLVMRNLTAHVKSYHHNKQFPCPTENCSRSFSSKQKMIQHQKTHDPKRSVKMKKARKKTKSAVSMLVKAIYGSQIQQNQACSSKPSTSGNSSDCVKTESDSEQIKTDAESETKIISSSAQTDHNVLFEHSDMECSTTDHSDLDLNVCNSASDFDTDNKSNVVKSETSSEIIIIDNESSQSDASDFTNEGMSKVVTKSEDICDTLTTVSDSIPIVRDAFNEITKVDRWTHIATIDKNTNDIVTKPVSNFQCESPANEIYGSGEEDQSNKNDLELVENRNVNSSESYEVLLQTECAVFKLVKENSTNGRKNM